MRKFKCTVCGFEFAESSAEFDDNGKICCPACCSPLEMLVELDSCCSDKADDGVVESSNIAYPKDFFRTDGSVRYMNEIHEMAVSGKPIIESMGIRNQFPSWDDILILGAQLCPTPLNHDADVNTETVIGRKALKPLVMSSPVLVSHMSYGALSKEGKIALAKGGALAATAVCSGEGGILPEEMKAAYRYIFEYVPNLYSVNDENLRNADAIEIKIGQGTKPGLGGHLPAEKVSGEIAVLRSKPVGKDIYSPSAFPNLKTRDDLKELVSEIRARSCGRPVGIKIAAGRIERDLEFCVYAGADFVTIDGRGGGSGSSPKLVRDSTSLPTIYALYRARKYLDAVGSELSLIVTGGLRVSSDFAKALAMGADAVAIATAALMAAACQQYRICGSGKCPVGMATQDPQMRSRFDIDSAALRVANFLNVSIEELKEFARLTGHSRLADLNVDDLCTVNREISDFTNIVHA